MNNCKTAISIIVPVYNTGKVLYETIDSILGQTYNDFELLLIDDGSTDGSGAVCDEYANKDHRIIVIHKKNGGICEARNYGIRSARGEYIGFCDHDDYYDRHLLEKAINAAISSNADIVKYGVRLEKELASYSSTTIRTYSSGLINTSDLKKNYFEMARKELLNCVWDGIYRAKIIKDNEIEFDTKYTKGHEDISFNLRLVPVTGSIIFIGDVLYTHVVRQSLSTSAKYYDEILTCLCCYPDDISSLCKNMDIDVNADGREYFCFYLDRVFIPIVSYMIKMRKQRGECIHRLKGLRNSSHIVPSISSANAHHYSKSGWLSKKGALLLYALFYHGEMELCYWLALSFFWGEHYLRSTRLVRSRRAKKMERLRINWTMRNR
jgi:Glycosyltransferases involved in cell wall biogenesis